MLLKKIWVLVFSIRIWFIQQIDNLSQLSTYSSSKGLEITKAVGVGLLQ